MDKSKERWTRTRFVRLEKNQPCSKCRTVMAKGKYARRVATYNGAWNCGTTRWFCPTGCFEAYYEPLGKFWDGCLVTNRQKWRAIQEKKEKSKTNPS